MGILQLCQYAIVNGYQKSLASHRKIYKDISNDHFTHEEQRQIEPYLKIHSKLKHDFYRSLGFKVYIANLMPIGGLVAMFAGARTSIENSKKYFKCKEVQMRSNGMIMLGIIGTLSQCWARP